MLYAWDDCCDAAGYVFAYDFGWYNRAGYEGNVHYWQYRRSYVDFTIALPERFIVCAVSLKLNVNYVSGRNTFELRTLDEPCGVYYPSGPDIVYDLIGGGSLMATKAYTSYSLITADLGQNGIDAVNAHRTWLTVGIKSDNETIASGIWTEAFDLPGGSNPPKLIIEGHRSQHGG